MSAKPSLMLYTVSFLDGEDRDPDEFREARGIGQALYDRLTRPGDDPLAYGAAVPVRVAAHPEHVDTNAARIVMVVAVLGARTFQLAHQRKRAIETMDRWAERLGPGHVISVPLVSSWPRTLGASDRRQWLLTELWGEDSRRRSLDGIVLALARLLSTGGEARERLGVRLFISHAKADLAETNEAAKRIHAHVVTDGTGKAFFDAVDLLPGHDFVKALEAAASEGMFVAVRGDAYSSRAWCQRELLAAKRSKVPTLTVDVVKVGEARTLPYAGNGPTLRWNDDPAEVASLAMVAWVKAKLFALEGERIKHDADLPDDIQVLAQPPELLDFAQGPLAGGGVIAVLHPDPELSVPEREVLLKAQRQLRLVTPSTMYRRALGRLDAGMQAPLSGLEVAISVSASADVKDSPTGLTEHHVMDAVAWVVRAMVSAGAELGYGGLFSIDETEPEATNYTLLLSRLIEAYNQTAETPAEILHSYLSALIPLETVPDDVLADVRSLRRPESLLDDGADTDSLPGDRRPIIEPLDSAAPPHRKALSFNDMRRIMTATTDARVVLGGKTDPKSPESPGGYSGPYPGVAEEAWWSLRAEKPLYVIGAFGGAAGLVATLLMQAMTEGDQAEALEDATPDALRDAVLRERSSAYGPLVDAFGTDPDRGRMELPSTADALAEDIRARARPLLKSSEVSRAWNGLSREENRELLVSQDPMTLATLVLGGLRQVARQRAEGRLDVELVLGDITAAQTLDAIAVGVYENVKLGGAGAAVDRAVGGRVSIARAAGQRLIRLQADGVDAGWLFLADLGPITELDRIDQRLKAAGEAIANVCDRHGFARVGLVTFAGANAEHEAGLDARARAMLAGLRDLAGRTTLVWHETDPKRFAELHSALKADEGVAVRVRKPEGAPVAARLEPPEVFVDVSEEPDGRLRVALLPPAGNAMAGVRRRQVAPGRLARYAEGRSRDTPSAATLTKWGEEVARLLFADARPGDDQDGDDQDGARRFLRRMKDQGARFTVTLDESTSRLPVELLQLPLDGQPFIPSLETGLVRRMALDVEPASLLPRPPHTGAVGVGLVVNPTGDLKGASDEADEILKCLASLGGTIQVVAHLVEDDATTASVRELLMDPVVDVFHYIGHAFYRGPGSSDSGLRLADDDLTVGALAGLAVQPRIAFVNACQSGRLRGAGAPDDDGVEAPESFAAVFLRSGIEAYLGTTWQVGDRAAAQFAGDVYDRLAQGLDVEQAVRESRNNLKDQERRDWGNYVLYGDGRFRLVVS